PEPGYWLDSPLWPLGRVLSALDTNDDLLRARCRTLCEETSERPRLYLLDQARFERSLVRSQRARICISYQGRGERFVSSQLTGEPGYHVTAPRWLQHNIHLQG